MDKYIPFKSNAHVYYMPFYDLFPIIDTHKSIFIYPLFDLWISKNIAFFGYPKFEQWTPITRFMYFHRSIFGESDICCILIIHKSNYG